MSQDAKSSRIILIVDDDEPHLVFVELSLKDEYTIYKAKSGEEALEFLGKGEVIPDLILLDILMPVMDGWIVYDRISDIASLKATPIMFFTSLDEKSAIDRAYELGAIDYLIKPCNRLALANRVKDTLQKADLRKKKYGL
jgi:PleD family two-component response regulator